MEFEKKPDFEKKVELDGDPTKQKILQDLRDAVAEVNMIKAGSLNGIPARDLINEL